jgi:hypothetical protein
MTIPMHPASAARCAYCRAVPKTVAHRRNSHPERLRPLDRERHGLLPGELAKRMPRIQHHR